MKQNNRLMKLFLLAAAVFAIDASLAASAKAGNSGDIVSGKQVHITPVASKKKRRRGISKTPSNSNRVLVVVNDQPITGYDVTQRIRLNQALNQRRGNSRKAALKELIDGIIQISAVKKKKINIDDRRVEAAIKSMTKSAGTTVPKLKVKLRKKGVGYTALKNQVKASLALRYLMQAAGTRIEKVSDAEVERRLRKFNSDPRLRSVTVYKLRQINLPIENTSSAMAGQLLQARAVEAQQIAARYRGCSSLRRAISGIYNVRLSNMVQADGSKLPRQMKRAVLQAGTRKLIGPMRVRNGIQMIAFCGTRKINPPKLTKEQARNIVQSEKYRNAAENIMAELRRKAYIDYKVAGARP